MSWIARNHLSGGAASGGQARAPVAQADMERFKAAQKEARRTGGKMPENPGPPPTGFALLPWLLMGMGAFSNLFQGKTPSPWIGGVGLLAFNSLYIYVAFRAFDKETREAAAHPGGAGRDGLITCALAIGYGGNWLYVLPAARPRHRRGRAAAAWLGRVGLGLTRARGGGLRVPGRLGRGRTSRTARSSPRW